jgi:hypothetical protein
MIKGYCKSNEDVFKGQEYWPNRFVALPQKGDYIQSNNGLYRAKILFITHKQRIDEYELIEPYIEVYITFKLTTTI